MRSDLFVLPVTGDDVYVLEGGSEGEVREGGGDFVVRVGDFLLHMELAVFFGFAGVGGGELLGWAAVFAGKWGQGLVMVWY